MYGANSEQKNAANVLLRNSAESCYWSQLPQLSYYKSENWFPSILTLPYNDFRPRPVFSNSQLIFLPSPRDPGQQGCQSCHFIAETFYDNPCETTMNTNIQAPPGDPVETTDFRTFHMNIIWLIIKTAVSQLSSHTTDLTADNVSPRTGLIYSQTQKNLHFLFEIFFVVPSFIAAKGWEVNNSDVKRKVQISALSKCYVAELLRSWLY